MGNATDEGRKDPVGGAGESCEGIFFGVLNKLGFQDANP